MMRRRRASLLVALCLLASAATAGADSVLLAGRLAAQVWEHVTRGLANALV